MPNRTSPPISLVVLMAMMMSMAALSIDMMLPALLDIAAEYQLENKNQSQWVVTAVFIGMAVGQLFYGPVSDRFGRKGPIALGYLLFCSGALLCFLAPSFELLIAGRLIQGMGAAAPRVLTVAIVRDKLQGEAMAKVMSVIFSVFILIPIFAPSLGQVVMHLAGWRWIFGVLFCAGAIVALWFSFGLEETLDKAKRRPLSLASIGEGFRFFFTQPQAVSYTVLSGLIFGVFMAYLNSASIIYIKLYEMGAMFGVLFAVAACSVGAASLVNGQLVTKLGMRPLVRGALIAVISLSALFLIVLLLLAELPPLWLLMGYMVLVFFSVGILFGNLNSLAMEPLGALAGLGSAIVASLSTLIAIPIGALIGANITTNVTPLVLGFLLCGSAGLLAQLWGLRASR